MYRFNGLNYKVYSGFFGSGVIWEPNNVNYTDTASLYPSSPNGTTYLNQGITFDLSNKATLTNGFINDTNRVPYTTLVTGYFFAKVSGPYIFSVSTYNSIGYIWVGDTAISGYTNQNYLCYCLSNQTNTNSIYLESYEYYPIRILVGAGTSINISTINITIKLPTTPVQYVDSGMLFITIPPRFPCFKENTLILTNTGYVPVELLKQGDLVKTLKHDYKPICLIGKKIIEHVASNERIKNQLYVCNQSNYPEVFQDLVLTGCHSILIDEFISKEQRDKTIEINGDTYVTDAKYRLPACADERANVYDIPGSYTIYHFALEHDDEYMNYGIFANGLLVETSNKKYMTELSNMELY